MVSTAARGSGRPRTRDGISRTNRANLAMLDASDLALALANAATVDEAIRAYENTMLPRSAEFARMLDGRAEDLLSADVPDFGGSADNRS
jgi:hypothetical protein